MINPLKVLLFLAGGTAVAGAGAYVTGALDPFFGQPAPAAVADLPASGEPRPQADGDATPKEDRVEGPADAGDQSQAADEPAAGDQPEVAAEQPPAADRKPGAPAVAALDPKPPVAETGPAATEPQPVAPATAVVPTFDLLRVEADGSMVIAGKAAPDARVELLSGGKVIGVSTADGGGDFVVILDKPLASGDYQITIRATDADNPSVASVQTAIVSVPKNASGQVLAMIEEPGKASEIITAPQPAVAAAENAEEARPGEQQAASAKQPKPGAETEKPVKSAAAPDTPPEAAGEGAPPAVNQAQPTATVPAEADVAAAGSGQDQPTATEEPATPAVDVAVEAVEIEGAMIFVAGRAASGSIVRVYANENLLGETRTSAAGRFLVEAERDLPVGSYIVRADVMAPDGVQVIARAAVPFEREPGENIAAIASSEEGSTQIEPKRAETAGNQSPAAGQPAAPSVAADAQAPAAAGEPAAEPNLPAIADATPPVAAGETAAPGSATTTADVQPGAGGQPAVPAASAEGQPTGDRLSATAQAQPPASTGPAAPEAPSNQKLVDVAGVTPPAEATAPPLQSVKSAVIIRRGDTLWRISKRVYGRGTRYSTIYLANQDQIRDPDMIWPGQVFGVPAKSREGEAADMSRIGEQATTKAQ